MYVQKSTLIYVVPTGGHGLAAAVACGHLSLLTAPEICFLIYGQQKQKNICQHTGNHFST